MGAHQQRRACEHQVRSELKQTETGYASLRLKRCFARRRCCASVRNRLPMRDDKNSKRREQL